MQVIEQQPLQRATQEYFISSVAISSFKHLSIVLDYLFQSETAYVAWLVNSDWLRSDL